MMVDPNRSAADESPPRPTGAIVAAAILLLLLIVVGVVLATRWDAFTGQVRETLGPPLHRLHAPLDRFLDSLPMWVAQACAIGLFVGAGIFAWSLPRRYVYLGAPDQARWRDLRIWATAVLVPYVIIYLLLGL